MKEIIQENRLIEELSEYSIRWLNVPWLDLNENTRYTHRPAVIIKEGSDFFAVRISSIKTISGNRLIDENEPMRPLRDDYEFELENWEELGLECPSYVVCDYIRRIIGIPRSEFVSILPRDQIKIMQTKINNFKKDKNKNIREFESWLLYKSPFDNKYSGKMIGANLDLLNTRNNCNYLDVCIMLDSVITKSNHNEENIIVCSKFYNKDNKPKFHFYSLIINYNGINSFRIILPKNKDSLANSAVFKLNTDDLDKAIQIENEWIMENFNFRNDLETISYILTEEDKDYIKNNDTSKILKYFKEKEIFSNNTILESSVVTRKPNEYEQKRLDIIEEQMKYISEEAKYIEKKITYGDIVKDIEWFYNGEVPNGAYKIDGQYYRVRVETIVKREINETPHVFFEKKDKPTHYGTMYKLPGGSVEPNKNLQEQAESEVNEEILCKVKNIRYTGKHYIVKYDPKDIPEWHKRILWPMGLKYVGAITFVFTAEYDGPYRKKVEDVDKDSLAQKGKWYPIWDFEELKSDVHQGITLEAMEVVEESTKKFKSSKVKNFEEFCKECKTPEDALNWFIAQKVVWTERANEENFRWPDQLIKERKGNCFDQSVFMHFFFEKKHIEHRMALFTIRTENGKQAGHIFPLYRKGKYIYAWLYIGPGMGIISGPYKDYDEAAERVTDFYKVLLLSGKKQFNSPISDETEWSVQDYEETKHFDEYLNKSIRQRDYMNDRGGDNLWSTHFCSKDFYFIRIPKINAIMAKLMYLTKEKMKNKEKVKEALEYIKESAVPVTEDHPDVINDYAIEDLNESTVKKYKPTYQGLRHIRCGDDYHGKIIIDISEVVGFVNVRKSDGMIQALEVNIEYREHGIGTLLLNIAIKLGATQLTVNVNNEVAHNMYLKNGWKDTKIIGKMQYMTYGIVKEASEVVNEKYFTKYESVEEPSDNMVTNSGIVDYVLNYMRDSIDIANFSSLKSGKRFMYTKCTVMKKDIPLVLFASYCEGLTTVLKKAEVEFYFSDTRPRLSGVESAYSGIIPFADGFLVYKKFPLENSLLMNGFALVDTKGINYVETDTKDVYVNMFEILFGMRKLANALDNFYDWFIDPVTFTVLEDLNYPTDFVGLLLAGNKLLADNNFTDELDMRNYRIRNNEMAYAYAFKQIADAYSRFRMTSNNKNPEKISIPQGVVLKDIMQSQVVDDVSELSPIVEAEKARAITTKGPRYKWALHW